MAYNLGSIISKVQNKLDDTGFSSAILTDFANDAQRELFNSRYFKFMEASQDFTVNAGSTDIGTLPSNLQQPRDLRIKTPEALASVLQPISPEEYDVFFNANAQNTQGSPSHWYYYDGKIYLYPIPSQDITVTLRYWKTPTELVNVTDVPEVPSEFQEILVLGMYKRALEYNDSFDQSAFINAQVDKLSEDMARRYTPQTSQPTVMGINSKRAWNRMRS
jgi:hypothetical protein